MLPIVGIAAIAFAIRVVHILQIRRAPFFTILMGDSRGYDEWAQRIAAGDWWGHEVFYQAPLYPYVLGAIYAVAGRNLLLVRLIQAVIGSASCVLVALAAERLVSRRAGITAGLMLALYAPAIFFDGLLQKSVLDVFFVTLGVWLVARLSPVNDEQLGVDPKKTSLRAPRALRSNVFWWLALGLAMGGLSLTRENAMVFVVVILAWALVAGREKRWRSAGAFVLGLAIVLVPVAVRNSLLSGGGFFVTTSQFGPNFYIGNNPHADGTYASLRYGRGAPEYERQDATEIAELALGRSLSPAEVSSYWTDRALQFIASQPSAWLELTARKLALLWNRAEVVDTEDQATHAEWSLPLRVLGPITNFGVLVPLAVLGLIVTWPQRSRWWVVYAMLAAYAASVVLFYVLARYRFPMVPMLIVFASAGVVAIPSFARSVVARGFQPSDPAARLKGSRYITLAAVVAVAVFVNWPILSTDLMRAVTENNLGVALQAERRFDEATNHYRRAIALEPEYAPAYSNLGTVLRANGHPVEAVEAYARALKLQPDYPDAHYNLANVLVDEGRTADAIQHFEVALRSIPGSAEVHNNLGIALAANGRRDDALAEFTAALRVDPNSAKAHRNLGDLLLSSGRAPEALDHFKRATELAPDEGSFHYDYGSVLLEAGRAQDAAAEFRAALRTLPDAPEVRNNLGIALGQLGRLDEAIAEFQEALRIRPDFVEAQRNLAMAKSGGKGNRRER